jgi:hypothetical protein
MHRQNLYGNLPICVEATRTTLAASYYLPLYLYAITDDSQLPHLITISSKSPEPRDAPAKGGDVSRAISESEVIDMGFEIRFYESHHPNPHPHALFMQLQVFNAG